MHVTLQLVAIHVKRNGCVRMFVQRVRVHVKRNATGAQACHMQLLVSGPRVEANILHAMWKSIRRGKVKWDEAIVKAWAEHINAVFPAFVHLRVRSESYSGGPIVTLKEPPTVTKEDVNTNNVTIKSCIMESPTEVPPAYFLADVFMYMNRFLFDGKLLQHASEPVETVAFKEGKLATIIGHLRYMCRPSPGRLQKSSSPDTDIAELKSLVRYLPRKHEGAEAPHSAPA